LTTSALVLIAVVALLGGVFGATASHPAVRLGRPVASHPSEAAGRPDRPLLAVIGASVSAGVGPGAAAQAWPQDLARMLSCRLAVNADPGAGYVSPGDGHRGPFTRLAAELDLARIAPTAVIIQGGHDDIGRPLPLIYTEVEALVRTIRRESPTSALGVLTVFGTGDIPSAAALATNSTIIAAARHADPHVLVFDPLAGHWHFARVADHLHPSAAGDQWIAAQLASRLGPVLRPVRNPA
jgi:lysophospholipase L1-like esterase